MEPTSPTEEDYLKAIFKLHENLSKAVPTNAIASEVNTTAASVSDMLKKLADKNLLHYEKYKGVTLTAEGNAVATGLIRRHRLWEVFLVEKLNFSWDEVHELAEQLEHIKSEKLIRRLDGFLGYPKFDPHGDPIPDENGNFTLRSQVLLSEFQQAEAIVVGVQEHSPVFLQHLVRLQLVLGARLVVLERFEYDGAMRIQVGGNHEHLVSGKVAQNIFVRPV